MFLLSISYMGCHPNPNDELIFFKMVGILPFSHILGINIIPTDSIIFQRVETTNQFFGSVDCEGKTMAPICEVITLAYYPDGRQEQLLREHGTGGPWGGPWVELVVNPKSTRIGIKS